VDTSPGGRGGANPNFLERLVVPLLLPRDPAMAPSLEIAVLDKRLLVLESLVGTAAIDLGRCTQEGKEGPGSVNLDYRRPGTPSVEEAEGGNPFMAAGSTPAMRAAFRRRSRRLKMTVLKQKKKHEVYELYANNNFRMCFFSSSRYSFLADYVQKIYRSVELRHTGFSACLSNFYPAFPLSRSLVLFSSLLFSFAPSLPTRRTRRWPQRRAKRLTTPTLPSRQPRRRKPTATPERRLPRQ
jgi:hypothetical protein